MEALAAVSTLSSSLSSTAPRPHHRLLTSPASGRSAWNLLPSPRAVSYSRAPLVVSHQAAAAAQAAAAQAAAAQAAAADGNRKLLRIAAAASVAPGGHLRTGPQGNLAVDLARARAGLVTCGGLCPGLNTVLRELVVGLQELYGVRDVFGVAAGYRGFYGADVDHVRLDPAAVDD